MTILWVQQILAFPLQRRATIIIHRRRSRLLSFIITHFHILILSWRGVGLGPGLGPFHSLALLTLFVLGCCFVEEGFAVALDGCLVFLADLGWVAHAVFLVVAFDKFLGGLLMLVLV